PPVPGGGPGADLARGGGRGIRGRRQRAAGQRGPNAGGPPPGLPALRGLSERRRCAAGVRGRAPVRAGLLARLAAPLAVFAVALAARAATAASISFPIPEGSAYYVAAARNLATGRGLVVDVLWSYATPPLQVPRPAF